MLIALTAFCFVQLFRPSSCTLRILPPAQVSDHRSFSKLEEENRQLKHTVAELLLDKRALQAVVGRKKVVSPQMRREAVLVMQAEIELSQRRACGLIGL